MRWTKSNAEEKLVNFPDLARNLQNEQFRDNTQPGKLWVLDTRCPVGGIGLGKFIFFVTVLASQSYLRWQSEYSAHCLETFACGWTPRSRRRVHWSRKKECVNLDYNMRCCVNKSISGFRGHGGAILECFRETGTFASNNPNVTDRGFSEARISICLTMSMEVDQCNRFDSLRDQRKQAKVIVLHDIPGLNWRSFNKYQSHEHSQRPTPKSTTLSAILLFQNAVTVAIKQWELHHQQCLDQIDRCVSVHSDAHQRRGIFSDTNRDLLFDRSFDKSWRYFQLLNILRVFSEWDREYYADTQRLNNLFSASGPLKELAEEYEDLELLSSLPTIERDWKDMMKKQYDIMERFKGQIKAKTDDIVGLRDALFNASSLLEASKSTQMNRYVITFTIVTVAFLPPSYIATLYGTQLFNDETSAQTITKFQIVIVSVSLGTYIVAFMLIRIADSLETLRWQAASLFLWTYTLLWKPLYEVLEYYVIYSALVLWTWSEKLRSSAPKLLGVLRRLRLRRRGNSDVETELAMSNTGARVLEIRPRRSRTGLRHEE
ncbi:hypothetical protein GGR52DRAFT_567283 [Hypoxylon sp. FL1284]|nr:hypothetical protein GGR52DRAFT_567283 [Hypoxylon sp. FL1284]